MDKILLYFAVIHQGDWRKIYHSIESLEKADEDVATKLYQQYEGRFITFLSPHYPAILKRTPQPPFVLFYEGNIELLKREKFAIVGSRKRSEYSAKNAYSIAQELAKNKIVIVSGLAQGVDTDAHTGALNYPESTIAVLAYGLNNIYPRQNFNLLKEIRKNHLAISEYPDDVTAQKEHFIARNRIIAGLTGRGLIVEAGKKSGTASTVAFLLDMDGEVFAFPQPAGESPGTQHLIKCGAPMVENAEDILDYYKFKEENE